MATAGAETARLSDSSHSLILANRTEEYLLTNIEDKMKINNMITALASFNFEGFRLYLLFACNMPMFVNVENLCGVDKTKS